MAHCAWETDAWQRGVANADPARLRDALKSGSIGFSFSGGGFFMPYNVGAIEALRQLGLLKPGITHVGGSSAGSLAAAIVSSGIPTEKALSSIRSFMVKMRGTGVYRKLGPSLRLALEEILPEDAHQRCEGTTFIAITKVKLYGALRSKRVSSFSNRRDLVKALLASCHLPVLSTGALTTSFRGRRVIDGGITDLMPVPHEPKHVVKISCMPLQVIKDLPMRNRHITEAHISITPCRFRTWPWDRDTSVKYMLGPGPDEAIDWLYKAGQEDIASWAYAAGITLPSPMAELAIKGADNHQQQAAAAGATAAGAAAGVAATKPGALPEASKPDAKTGAEAAAGAAQQGAAAVFMATEGAAGQKVANGRLPEEQDGEEAPPPGARSLADHAEWLQRKELEAHGALK